MSAVKKLKMNDTSSRPYQTEWFGKYGAVEIDKKILCLICKENITSRAYNVKRHFEKIHTNLASLTEEEKKEYFSQKLKEYKSQANVFKTFLIPKNNITAASFHVAHCIARHGKPLSEGEFLKEAFLECSAALFADFKEKDLIIKRINELPISRNTITERILRLDENTSSQINYDLKCAEMYSIALDETTDISGYAQLAVFARYKSGNIMREELVKLITLTGRTTGLAVFKEFADTFMKMNIDLQKIVSVTTDGAPSMIGKNIGFIQQLKHSVQHSLIEFHCLIHQEVLCAKQGLKTFSNVMPVVTKIVNFINARALNKREFAKLLEEIDSQYSGLLMYNNVRWLSRGQVLNRFVDLLEEIKLFLHEKNNVFDKLSNIEWLNDLMFCCDITQHFNELNKKLQGPGQVVLVMFENIKTFMTKLDIFSNDLKMKILKYFPYLQKHFQATESFENSIITQDHTIKKYLTVIEEIKQAFLDRFNQFKDLEKTLHFILYPHKIEFNNLELTVFTWLGIENLEMELAEFQNSFMWKNKFENLITDLQKQVLENISDNKKKAFEQRTDNIILKEWDSLPDTFNTMKKLANALLTMFGSTYVCETLFSSMNFIKSTQRNRLGNELTAACLKVMNSKYDPNIQELSENKQQQVSH